MKNFKTADLPRRRNLLVVRAGDESLHPQWLKGNKPRSFDLLVSYYGETVDRYQDTADYYHVMQGPRWPAHDAICRENAAWLSSYEYVAFACDDLGATAATWNRLFETCRRYALDLAQPAIDGPVSYAITQPVAGCVLRYTNYVEIMCPVFSRRAHGCLKSSFNESQSGWGLGLIWQKFCGEHDFRMAIIDAVRVVHSRPLGQGTLYSVLEARSVNAQAELEEICVRFGLQQGDMRELSRIPAWFSWVGSPLSRLLQRFMRRR